MLLQTKGVLTRPWVILELYTAITNQVPVVALNIKNAFAYDYGEAAELLMHLDEELERANPGAADLLREQGVDPVDAAFRLTDALPNIISTTFDPNGSTRQIEAALQDLADQIHNAQPIAPTTNKEEWLEKRRQQKMKLATRKARPHGQGQAPAAGKTSSAAAQRMARVPDTVPELPGEVLVRSELLAQIKSEILNEAGSPTAALTSEMAKHKSSVHGMGGVGREFRAPPAPLRSGPSAPCTYVRLPLVW